MNEEKSSQGWVLMKKRVAEVGTYEERVPFGFTVMIQDHKTAPGAILAGENPGVVQRGQAT